jgi:hypothetical protein
MVCAPPAPAVSPPATAPSVAVATRIAPQPQMPLLAWLFVHAAASHAQSVGARRA